MANISLTKENIKYIRDAFSHFFPEDTVYSADKPFASGEFNWQNRGNFIDFVYRLTGVQIKSEKDFQNIKKAELAVEELAIADKNPEANTLTPEKLKQLEKEEGLRAEELKKTQEDAKKRVESAKTKKEELTKEFLQKKAIAEAKKNIEATIKKQQGVQESLRNKKIYAKVEISKEAPPPDENTKKFIAQAQNYPKSFEKDLTQNIKAKLNATLSDKLTPEEIDVIASKTAVDTVSAINNFPEQSSANTQAAILAKLSKDYQVLPKIISDKNSIEFLQNASSELSFFKNNTVLSKMVLSSVNENLATSVFGTGPENLNVTFSDQPMEGYTHEVDLGQLNSGYSSLLNSQSRVLDSIGSSTGDNIKSVLMGQTRNFLDSQILKLPADSAITKLYSSEIGQQVLNFAGLGKTVPLGEGFLGEGFLGGFIQQVPGASAFFEGIGSTFGINFGIGAAAPAAEVASTALLATEGAAVVEGAAITTGITAVGTTAIGVEAGAMAGTAGGAVAGATVGTVAGITIGQVVIPIPVIGAAIGAALTSAVTWVAKKINWAKIKENLIAISGGLLVAGLVLNIPALMIGGGIGLVGGIINGGISGIGAALSGIGSGIVGFFGALGGAFVGAIGTPITVTFLAFPVVVAFILFMINSGAYIVPPGGPTLNGGLIGLCTTGGADITSQMAGKMTGGQVLLLPPTNGARASGLCIIPTMIILHTSGGYDNATGANMTYNYISSKNLACQLATDTTKTLLMEPFYEKQVEMAWCANSWNAYGISIEISGECQGPTCSTQYSACGPYDNLTFSNPPPHPCAPESDLAASAVCASMTQYKIPWCQIYTHDDVPDSTHGDPIGKDWVYKYFIPKIKSMCPNDPTNICG